MLSPPPRAWTTGAMFSPVAKQPGELHRRAASIWDPSTRPTGRLVRIFLGMRFAPARETPSRSPFTSPEWGCVSGTRSPFTVCVVVCLICFTQSETLAAAG